MCVVALPVPAQDYQDPSLLPSPRRASSGWVESDQGLGWIGGFVSMGDGGTNVFAYLSLNHSAAVLFPSRNSNPPVAHWQLPPAAQDLSQPRGAAAARSADVYVAIVETVDELDPSLRAIDTLRFSRDGQLEWAYRHPFPTDEPPATSSSHVAVSADGQTIVTTAHGYPNGTNEVLVFAPDAPVPLRSIPLGPGVVWRLELSADGTVAALGVGTTVLVLEPGSGVLRYEKNLGAQITDGAVALSGDGFLLAYARGITNGDFIVLRWTGVRYDPRYVVRAPLSGARYRAIAVSDDGSTIAAGTALPYPGTVCSVEAFDAASGAVAMQEILSAVPGPQGYQNIVMDLALSADGRRLAAGLSGDEELFPPVEEIRVYDTFSSVPLLTRNLPGSALAVDVSADGRWAVVGSKDVHLNELGRGGRIDLIRLP